MSSLQSLPSLTYAHHKLLCVYLRPGSPTRPEASRGSVPYLILFHTFYSGTWSALDRYVIRLEKKFQCQHLQQSVIQLECPCKHRSSFCESQQAALFCSDGPGSELPGRFSFSLLRQSWAHLLTASHCTYPRPGPKPLHLCLPYTMAEI